MTNVFITFEGIDGSGKDTLIEHCIHLIKSRPEVFGDKYSNIWITREPTKITCAGKKLAQKLKHGFASKFEAAQLFVEDRIEHSNIIKQILPYSHVLCSRYDLSTLAYQKTQGLDFEELYNMHRYNESKGTLIPNLTIYIKTDPHIAFKRIHKRNENRNENREIFETLDFQIELSKNYDFVIEKLRKRGREVITINGNTELEEVKKELRKALIKVQHKITKKH